MTFNSIDNISYFAKTTFRNQGKRFGIQERDRMYHLYTIGKTGVGKSTLLENLMWHDALAGRGFALLDPHGELVESVRRWLPEERWADVIDFDVTDPALALGFNPLEPVAAHRRGLAAAGLMDAFKKLWPDSWGPRLEYLLRNALFALLEQPTATLPDVLRFFTERDFRRAALRHVTNPHVKRFWETEYANYSPRFQVEAAAPILNKVGAFATDPRMARILSVEKSSFRLRDIMDKGKILLVNLAKGRIGEDMSALLGGLLVARINLAALSRADSAPESRRPFFCYLDEFQTFTSLTFVTMLSELRKYQVGMALAHQYLAQLEPEILDAVLGNVGTLIIFRVGGRDARALIPEFEPKFEVTDLTNLPKHHVALKLMIDGSVSQPFSAETLPPMQHKKIENA